MLENSGGGLGFFTTLLMAEIGRATTKPPIMRGLGVNPSAELRMNLGLRYTAVVALPRRITPFARSPPAGAHSGTQRDGGISVRFNYADRSTISFHLLHRRCQHADPAGGEPPISLYELFSAIRVAFSLGEVSGREFPARLLYVGNQAAVDALVPGSSSAPSGVLLVSIFRRAAIRRNAPWRVGYVSTKANAADAPSRESFRGALSRASRCGPPQAGFSTVAASFDSMRKATLCIAGFNWKRYQGILDNTPFHLMEER